MDIVKGAEKIVEEKLLKEALERQKELKEIEESEGNVY